MAVFVWMLTALLVGFCTAEPPVSNTYLPPHGPAAHPPPNYGAPSQEESEPANYQFEYAVVDEASGNDFGHKESREGDVATGVYYVVLPDGRKQTVEYIADSNGYMPKITYEDGFPVVSGYPAKPDAGYKY